MFPNSADKQNTATLPQFHVLVFSLGRLLPTCDSRISVVTRFLGQIVLKRRQNRAANILAGSLSAFTSSNAIERYAKRVKWGSRHLQALARRRMACMTAHLTLLNRQWDRLYPPPPPTATLPRAKSNSDTGVLPPATATKNVASPPSSPNNARSARRQRRGGGGGKQKGNSRQKRQGRALAAADTAQTGEADADDVPICDQDKGSSTSTTAREKQVCVSSKAKREELLAWLRTTRANHSAAMVNYERFTVRRMFCSLLD